MKSVNKGFVLVSALLLLLVMTLLGIATMSVVVQKERVSHNAQLGTQVMMQGESVLKEGELTLTSSARPDINTAVSNTDSASLLAANDAWWTSNGVASQEYNSSRYIIQEAAFVPDDLDPDTLASGVGTGLYRVSAWTTGPDSAEIILQSIFAQRY